jgi:hypothetical protein
MSISEYAVLSSAVYSAPDRQAALDSISVSSKNKYNGSNYRILEGDSDYMVFRRLSDQGIIVACRGTRDTTDVIPDVFIALGLLRFHPRSKKILAVVDRYKYMGMDVSVTGHSLGGKLAALIGATEGVLAVTFNQGASPMDSNPAVVEIQEKLLGYNYNNVIHVTTAIDGVSTTEAIVRTNRTVVVTPPSYINPLTNHGLAAFLDMSEEDASRATGVMNTERVRIQKEQNDAPTVDNIATQLKNARTYAGNSVNVYKLNRDYFETIMGPEQIEAMDQLVADEGITSADRAREMLRISFDDSEIGGDYKMKSDEDYMTDEKLDKLILDEDARIARAREFSSGDEFDADLDDAGLLDEENAEKYGRGDEFERDLNEIEGVDIGDVGRDADRRALMSEDEFIDDIGAGISSGATTLDRLNIFENNIKNMDYLSPEMKEELLSKVSELRASQTVSRSLENVGLFQMAKAVRAVSTKLGARWATLIAKDVTMFGGRIAFNVGSVLKKLGKVMNVVMILTQVAFIASEIFDMVTIKNEMTKLLDNSALPEFKFLRFKIKVALERLDFLYTYGSIKTGVHAVEVVVGILLTLFPGTQAIAVAWWAGVAAEQIAEIPGDMIIGGAVKREFVAKWYGSPASFRTHLFLRDSEARSVGEPGDVVKYLHYISMGLYIDSFNIPEWAVPVLMSISDEMKERVRVIVEDPLVENGIADNRYERLVQLQTDVPTSLFADGLRNLTINMVNRPKITTPEDVVIYGARGFTPKNIQEYHDLQRFADGQRYKLLSHSSHEKYFLDSGNNSQGDNESDEEYTVRVNTWLDLQVQILNSDMLARSKLDEEEYDAWVKQRLALFAEPVLTTETDGSACIYVPKSKRKTMDSPYIDFRGGGYGANSIKKL